MPTPFPPHRLDAASFPPPRSAFPAHRPPPPRSAFRAHPPAKCFSVPAASCLLPVALILAVVCPLQAANRSIDGFGNNPAVSTQGAANTPYIRFSYPAVYPGDHTGTTMLNDMQRANPRDISNLIVAQSTSVPSSRRLSDYIWGWGQFLTHDLSLTTSSDGAAVNGSASIPVNDPQDPLGPNPIPLTRSNFKLDNLGIRQQVNEITSYIDASNVYGSDAVRAAALRTDGGTGAKLATGPGNLLPLNTAGLPNENLGQTPDDQLFLAGDIRANENVMLTSLHTLFVREHNRLVDVIAVQEPGLNNEEQYQLARTIVGAELQIITYNEFLPALLGTTHTPSALDYNYDATLDASVTQSFAHAANRFGHSAVSPNLQLVNDDGTSAGSVALRNASSNPGMLTGDPAMVELLLKGAATQISQEIDLRVIEDLRTIPFGAPGAGGTDLAAVDIQRGRDHGLPDYNSLRQFYKLRKLNTFGAISPDAELAEMLETLYGPGTLNIDAWVGALAEPHLDDSSVGPLMNAILVNQFERLRDGDRMFYLSDEAGLYDGGVLNEDIRSILDLDDLRLSDVIRANTTITHLPSNVFFVPLPGDYNGDGLVNALDYVVWRDSLASTSDLRADGDGSGTVDQADYTLWRNNWSGTGGQSVGSAAIPEPPSASLGVQLVGIAFIRRRMVRTANP